MGRKRRPVWQIKIDAFIFHYVDDPATIRAQKLRIRELELTGTKTTGSYELMEGSRGGESTTKEERYVLEMENAREQIEISQERIELVEGLLKSHFTPEERQFIWLYWLGIEAGHRGSTYIRTRAVIDVIGWLRDPDDKRRPSREFRRWRQRIYNKWWEILFPDLPKPQWNEEYVAHIEIERESCYLNAEELK